MRKLHEPFHLVRGDTDIVLYTREAILNALLTILLGSESEGDKSLVKSLADLIKDGKSI